MVNLKTHLRNFKLSLLVCLSIGCGQNPFGGTNSNIQNTYAPGYSGNLAELNPSWTPNYNNLVGYWTMDTSFNGKLGPSMTSAGSGSTISNSLFKVGIGSGSFNGTSYAAVPASSMFSFPNTSFTVMGWINTTSSGGFVVSNGLVGNGWGVQVIGANIFAEMKDCSNRSIILGSTASITDGNWHHWAVTYRTDTSVTTNNVFQIYIDGINNGGTMNYGTAGPYCDPGSLQALALGARDVPTGPITFLVGNLDDFSVWDVGLTSGAISAIYNMQSPVFASLNEMQKMRAYRKAFDGLQTYYLAQFLFDSSLIN